MGIMENKYKKNRVSKYLKYYFIFVYIFLLGISFIGLYLLYLNIALKKLLSIDNLKYLLSIVIIVISIKGLFNEFKNS